MFWKILLGWTVVGAVLEAITGVCIGFYAAFRLDASGYAKADMSDMLDKIHKGAFDKHYEWSDWLYRVLPWHLAEVIELLWQFAVWPLEVPLLIHQFKKQIDEQLLDDVNKAS